MRIDNPTKETEKDKAGLSKWIVICMILMIFTVFLFMKIEGFYDYTGKYGIEWIRESEFGNGVMMIDGDPETTWGIVETFEKGSMIMMKFRDRRSISGISIINASEYDTIPVSIYVSDNGESFEYCDHAEEDEGIKKTYRFNTEAEGILLMLVYEAEDTGHWPITEVEIYD